MKKVELHLHLDGSVLISSAYELLGKNISIENLRKDMQVNGKCKNLSEYLTKFDLPQSMMQTKENLTKISYDLANSLKKDNVIYAEIRFAPQFHVKENLTYDEVVEAVLEGLNRVDIKTNLILCLMRGKYNYEENLNTIKCAKRFLKKGVCAIDLAGDEASYSTKNYEKLFEIARKEKIPYTIHAGEARGKDSIEAAIDMKTTRIGHGIRCIEDDNLVKKLKEENITLEICPISNIQTNAVLDIIHHPIYKLYKSGVRVTVNTDNRTVSNTNLYKEYELLLNNFDFSIDDFVTMNKYAIAASFISDEEKEKLYKMLEE